LGIWLYPDITAIGRTAIDTTKQRRKQMEILVKLQAKTADIQKTWHSGGKQKAETMRALAVLALEEGLRAPSDGKPSAWVDYVRLITTADEEIKRLTGRDEVFNDVENAKGILTYVVANGVCTEFSFADTTRYLSGKEIRDLDA
jgi:hypothetical protein